MDPVTLILLGRFVVAVLMVYAGIYIFNRGIKLYRDGTGLRADGTEVQLKKVKLSLKTAGSVVMALSLSWGFFSWQTGRPRAHSRLSYCRSRQLIPCPL